MSAPRPDPGVPGSRSQRLAQLTAEIGRSRAAVFVRREDAVLLVRPDKTAGLNATAVEILGALYGDRSGDLGRVLDELAARLGAERERLLGDAEGLVRAVLGLLRDDFSPGDYLCHGPFDRARLRYPTLAEIALTYGCQNRCRFCYAASPRRGAETPPMDAAAVVRVMERIFHQAHVPSLSFTGGEPTLRPDLPELVRAGADLGFRMNLITNGRCCGRPGFAAALADAGLASAQVSLEAAEPGLHDQLVGRPGAQAETLRGIEALRRAGLHVHTNTTLCRDNLDAAEDLVRFVAALGLRTLSMNLFIPTGTARVTRSELGVSYTELASRLPALLAAAREVGVRLVWYSPLPYCLFNPVHHGLGAKACACVDGILSVDPTGQVLPCSSFEEGLGSLLERPWEAIERSRAARYWKRKEFLPPPCRTCPEADLCSGACPLYWDAAGSFAELPRPGSDDPAAYRRWAGRRRRGGSLGARPRSEEEVCRWAP